MNTKLDKSEKQIADDFAEGKYKKSKRTLDMVSIAKNTKESRINLRLQEEVLLYFQSEAKKQGIPYQTLINSVLFKIATGQLVEVEDFDLRRELSDIKKKISEISFKKEA